MDESKEYIQLFNTVEQLQEAYMGLETYVEPWVSLCLENSAVTYNKSEYEKLLCTPLTFKIISAGTIVWAAQDTTYTKTIEYKLNDGEWASITSNTGASAPSISVDAGDVVRFIGNNATYSSGSSRYNSFSGSTAKFEVEGNIMSLIDSTGYTEATTLASSYTFYYLFSYCTGLTSTENLILPATTLANYCYNNMFYNCTSLITAPELPATTLVEGCYQNMFSGCRSLATAPELPATALHNKCYFGMFTDCTSLTTAPELPATILSHTCYQYMFYGCSSLTTAPELPATILARNCYNGMFSGCTSLTQAPELPATTLTTNCYAGMFSNCTSLTQAPELPAMTLSASCYSNMFSGCTSLTTAPALPATTLTPYCYSNMFLGCTSLTQAPELPATTLTERCYRCMFSGCRSLTILPELPATTLANGCYEYMFQNCTTLMTVSSIYLPVMTLAVACYWGMFYGCSSLTTAPELPATTLTEYCYIEMFKGCQKLTTAPVLPATTLTNYCYKEMFNRCTSLNYIKCLATDITASQCTYNWVYNVASSGTFVKDPNMSSWTTGDDGIPTNWTVKKINPVSVSAGDIDVGDTVIVSVVCPGDYVGNCHLTINSVEYIDSVMDGRVNFRISGLSAGAYIAYAELPETSIYEAASGTVTFNVSKIEPAISIDLSDVAAQQPITITVTIPEEYEDDCHLTLNNVEYVLPNKEGKATFNLPGLPAGTYTVYVELPETATYESASSTDTLTVRPA